jgi:S1-C subfamily serine protease
MKVLAGLLFALLALPVFASGKITEITIDGTSFVQIQDVHLASAARIVILVSGGGTTLPAEKVPADFLSSWGITPAMVSASKSAAEKRSQDALEQAVRAGYFREVEGVIYDLRKLQPAWKQFTGAKVVQMVEGGALVEVSSYDPTPSAIFVRNLPRVYADNDKVTFRAMQAGDFSYVNRFGFEHTVHAYDVGRICQRNEIPDVLINGFQASAGTPFSAEPRAARERPAEERPGGQGLRAIGSGFFVTPDGYLLTNFHVVDGANKVRVKYKSRIYPAKVVQTDKTGDLALVKVEGSDFSSLAISRKDSAELGDEVFTIGFPNIDMQGLEPKYTDGKISSLAGMQDDPSEYQISVPVQPGNSGGPLCDENGEVVGIVVARLNDFAALRESGAVPQNVNYAVKSRLALQLLTGIKGMDAVLMKTSGKPAKPVQRVENAIAMLMIY